ncbi:signal peptide peptidase SppA [Francisella tularensis subsp. novicida]|uniref:Signal peptide peptidase SppA n=2 Tax=Francisella tularensis TaxID=263 RepID=A0A6I4RUY3_FRATU|nr:signal peptide peptidase SppA [Francisella tularensis]ABK89029.1 serine peptidase, S49 family [Francisella tularensis subsp. novicida U112]AJI45245.1 signal peptide peptidase SppA, 36K type [Francisella tularensis subsp. novicida F6168]AJI60602.1 signal peptide peptidase SppA, 36K type [Francisella tularensis subsp. novicida U112]AJI72460.1 signal peptide peptidase SppA, 36K type [Francisella tularensis subsp. novicida D9876]AJJ48188.1 signal peptide peptidase SppA, 36K type [Francisella tu
MENNISNTTLEKLAQAYLKDIKSKRRWRLFTRLIIILMILLLIVPSLFSSSKELVPHIALIKVNGVIADDAEANAERINQSLDDAYANKSVKGVIVEINSPGGSPVQSDEIYSHMQYLQHKYPTIPMYAVCTDVCASGGYYIAAGAKDIYANKMTITGSIGVIGSGFGFTGLMDKLGIERRTYTSGENKDFLDPFSPQKPEQTAQFKKLLDQTHQVFIAAVEKSRGDRLKDKNIDTTFSGEPFSGIQAQQMGLIDGFASVDQIRNEKFNNIDIVDYTRPLDFLTAVSHKLGNSIYYKALSETSFSLK